MAFKTLVITAVLVVVPAVSALAQHRGSPEDQLACTPDVYRLCSQFIPDEDDIVSCLERSKAQLTPACKTVFSRPSEPKPKSEDDDQ